MPLLDQFVSAGGTSVDTACASAVVRRLERGRVPSWGLSRTIPLPSVILRAQPNDPANEGDLARM